MTPLDSSYRLIPLTQGQFAKVSAHRFEYLSQFKWYAKWSKSTGTFYAFRSLAKENGKQRWTSMHRFIMGLAVGDPRHVDHANGDSLDNTDENLREATRSQNVCNRKIQKSNKSGFKGVCKQTHSSTYVVSISLNGTRHYLGTVRDPIEGSKLYEAAARKLHGEFFRE